MTNNSVVLFQPGQQQLSTVLHGAMEKMQASELQQNVGAAFPVVSIKGKTFGIKHAGKTTPLTVNYQGQVFAAPFFDVVLVKANGSLSKTYYRENYADGSDAQPDCWSEDGVTPLAPLAKRPIDPRTNTPCTDCRLCPMNAFGSKTTDNGSRSKACADTRKVVVVPAGGQRVDFENAQFGGPMLLRVPAASLRPLAEYDAQLKGMGLPYFGVVTRLTFDATQAFPKLSMQAVRPLTDDEATELLALRDSPVVANILESAQASAPEPAGALPPPQVPSGQPVAPTAPQAPSAGPAATVEQLLAGATPVAAPPPAAPAQAVPVQAAPTPPPVNVPAPPAAPTPPSAEPQPPAGFAMAPGAASYKSFIDAGWTDQQMQANGHMVPVAAPAAPPAPPAPPAAPSVPPPAALPSNVAAAAPAQAAPVPPATPELLQSVDALLNS